MSVQIKSLTNGSPPVRDNTNAAAIDDFNIIPEQNVVFSLYTAPPTKAAIVKSIRMTNIKAQTINITLYFNRPDANNGFRRRVLLPKPMSISAQNTFIDDSEITLEPGDSIQAECNLANAVHYVISGVEREVT